MSNSATSATPRKQLAGDRFWTQGEPLVWATGGALALVLLSALLLLVVVLVNGLGVFWPSAIAEVTLQDGTRLLGKRCERETNADTGQRQIQFKTANREFDPARMDFRWIPEESIAETRFPDDVFVLERASNGDFYGFLRELKAAGLDVPSEGELPEQFAAAMRAVGAYRAAELEPVAANIAALCDRLQDVDYALLNASYKKKAAGEAGPPEGLDARIEGLAADKADIQRQTQRLVARQQGLQSELRRNVAIFDDGQGHPRTIVLADVVRSYRPGAMGLLAKMGHYAAKIWELLASQPRESNTEGGLFPAIFGTVTLIFLMALCSFPLGVLAGVYLGEYARDGLFVRLVRIGVNNLAGIPSIVYGIFGVGFFIYGLGRTVDQWFFPERLASGPVFGTGGVLWASMTLGLLTVPVVIVATEEAIRAVARGVRESSYALGATKFQTLMRVILPLAAPGIMTGFILAMARAAGEVAPLMITGVVKSANNLPVDGKFPFFHLDRQFMHLGFHIYDVGFQSPNVEASKPMVYVTTLLLVLIVLMMSALAIYLRNRMRKKMQIRTI